jgi:hypothetical protein
MRPNEGLKKFILLNLAFVVGLVVILFSSILFNAFSDEAFPAIYNSAQVVVLTMTHRLVDEDKFFTANGHFYTKVSPVPVSCLSELI